MRSEIFDLTCSYMDNPLGIDSLPRFSWKYSFSTSTGNQGSYRITVSSSEENMKNRIFDMWDTGLVTSEKSQFVEYKGLQLSPRKRYWWRVYIEDEKYNKYSSFNWFETGKLNERWDGRWLSACFHKKPDEALDAPYFRKYFKTDKKNITARLYI